MLTFKTVTLLTLLSVQRIQTVHLSDICNVDLSESIVKICVGDMLKQTRPGYHLRELDFPAYPPDKSLCPIFTVREYLSQTNPLRGKVNYKLVYQFCKTI